MSNIQAFVPSLLKMYAGKIAISPSARRCAIATLAVLLTIVTWANLLFHVDIDANAAIIQSVSPVVAIEGIGDRVEGKVEKDIGTVQRNVGKVTGQTEGALKQAEGEAKQNLGKAKNKLDNAADKAEDTSKNFIDSVKNFFD